MLSDAPSDDEPLLLRTKILEALGSTDGGPGPAEARLERGRSELLV